MERCRSQRLLWEDQVPILLRALDRALSRAGGKRRSGA